MFKNKDKGIYDASKSGINVSGNKTFSSGELVYYKHSSKPNKPNKLKIGGIIEIEKDQIGFVVVDGRVGEVLFPGKNKIQQSALPLTMELLNSKYKDNKAVLDSMKTVLLADVYIINQAEFTIANFKTSKFRIRTSAKDENVNLILNIQAKIANPQKFLDYIVQEVPEILPGYALKFIKFYIDNSLRHVLEFMDFTKRDLIDNKLDVEEYLIFQANSQLGDTGVKISNLVMNKLIIAGEEFLITEGAVLETKKTLLKESNQEVKKTKQDFNDVYLEMFGYHGAGDKIKHMTEFANKQRDSELGSGNIVFERVKPFGERDNAVNVKMIAGGQTKNASAILNVDTSQIEKKEND